MTQRSKKPQKGTCEGKECSTWKDSASLTGIYGRENENTRHQRPVSVLVPPETSVDHPTRSLVLLGPVGVASQPACPAPWALGQKELEYYNPKRILAS